MKQLWCALLLLVGFSAFCAYQYDTVAIKGTDSTAVVFGHGGSMSNMLYFNNNAQISFKFAGQNGGDWGNLTFGMYTIDNAGQSILKDFGGMNVTGGTQSFAGGVNAGDYVGFWVSNGDITRYITPGINGVTGTYAAQRINPDGTYRVGFTFDGYFGDPAALDTRSNVLFDVAVKDAAPSGQPLPGVLATVLLGGGAAGAFGWKRRKTEKM